MRICLLGDAGHPNLVNWARVLVAKLGHEVHVLTFNPLCEPVVGLNVHVLEWSPHTRPLRYVLGVPHVRRAVRALNPDVLIGYRLTSYGFMAMCSGYRPWVAVSQGSDLFYPGDPLFQRWLVRLVCGRADLVQAWAPHMEARLRDLGAKSRAVLTLPKGVDRSLFKPLPGVHDRPTLVSTRQLRFEYNHHLILDAVARLVPKIPNLHYIICGDGERRRDLEARSIELGLRGHVTFTGRVLQEDLPVLLSRAEVYVSLQPSDGVSASLLEAMACGLFPVVADNDANRAWIDDGTNGFLVRPTTREAFDRRLEEALCREALRDRARSLNIELVASRACLVANTAAMCRRYAELGGR
jgi:glycosyltransferase involved in cell wall biosynthesis